MENNTQIPDAQTLQQAIENIHTVVDGPLPSPDYFDGFKRWLKDRMDDWDKTSLRIGLVGITSAGKSTFINALAGEDILPRGAQPTSGILVVCRRSDKRQLKVMFKQQEEYEFTGDECTPLWVKRYADEEENPNNEQGVSEMHLYLPKLAIPAKYDLIDSPGLDAFGLKGHEELTLRTLIPLVDVVLFLTTTKSTSDRENLKALAKICRERKPAIVIQTHKDAVEPRYMKGGKILETAEQVLEKHHNRVKELLRQSMTLENAHIVQVSSIQALNARTQNPDAELDDLEDWHESGFSEIVQVLEKLHNQVSIKIVEKRLTLLLRETQQLLDRVKTDYFSARGKEKEAQHIRDLERNRLAELETSIPTEEDIDFPDATLLQNEIAAIVTLINEAVTNWDEERLEGLPTVIRDKIKVLENSFFRKADVVEERIGKIAEDLSIDLEAIKPESQREYPDIPELKRFEKMVKMEVLEGVGVSGRVKRLMGKLFKKTDWGYREREITETLIDRDSLKEDMMDYHSLYQVKLTNYLKQWMINWANSTGAILSAIAQRRDDINRAPVKSDPEPYRLLLGNLRGVRDWIESRFKDSPKGQTGRFEIKKKLKKQADAGMTTRSATNFNILLPLLQTSRTLVFTRKTHRFWHVVNQVCKENKPNKCVLISTPFANEIIDYLTVLGDLTIVEEPDLHENIIVYGNLPFTFPEDEFPESSVPVKVIESTEGQRDEWFLQRTSIILVHDKILQSPSGNEKFTHILSQADMIFRAVDLHQIGHEQMRLHKLPVRDMLAECKDRIAYIGVGADRLLKGRQFIDAFKSYLALRNPPGFGLRPFVLADGEELLTSLLWLANTLGNEASVSDELKAMDILTRTQPEMVAGKESFIRNFFQEVKKFQKEVTFMDSLQ